jgi:hypothetical protein
LRNTSISRHSITNLANAFSYSEEVSLPLTAFLVIAWTKTEGWHDDLLTQRQSELFYRLARWFRRKDLPAAYVWTLENSRRMGLHLNLAIHVPAYLFQEFVTEFHKFIPGYLPDRYVLEFIADQGEGSPKFFPNAKCRAGTLRYFCKGLDHKATFNGPDGTRLNFGDAIGIEHRGSQGVVPGKRAGVSHALGLRQRLRSGYTDMTSPEDLHSIFNP